MQSRLRSRIVIATALLAMSASAVGTVNYHLANTYKFGATSGGREYFDYITLDSGARRLYLSHGTEVVVVNADSGKDEGKISGLSSAAGKIPFAPIAPAGAPAPIAIDREHRRLFVAGREPAMLVVMNADDGKVIQSFPISNGADAEVYDPKSG